MLRFNIRRVLFILAVVILFVAAVTGWIAYLGRVTIDEQELSIQRSLLSPSPLIEKRVKCAYYGLLDQDFFLTKYTVQKGDTLLSVAKNQLGDSSRVDELIQLNKQTYPSISIQNPTIEVGWILRISPKYFPRWTGILEGEGGKVLENTNDDIVITVRSDQNVPTISYKTAQTKYLGQDTFKVGDCVYILEEGSTNITVPIADYLYVLAISPQHKNYFKDENYH